MRVRIIVDGGWLGDVEVTRETLTSSNMADIEHARLLRLIDAARDQIIRAYTLDGIPARVQP